MFQRNNQTYSPYATSRASSGGSSKLRFIARQVNWALVVGFLVAMAATLYMTTIPSLMGIGTFCFILVGWVFSLTAHESAHAATAFLSGDTSTSTIRYLSANPLHYINPLMSIIFPLLFVLLGGIGLPGGAVYLNLQYVHDRNLRAAVSLAGPLANLVILGALVALLRVGIMLGLPGFTFATGLAAAAALGFLAFLQLSAILLNLIPIPGLDGYGALENYLSYQVRQQFEVIRPYGFLILFGLFWLVPPFTNFFFGVVDAGLGLFGVDPGLAGLGWNYFHFWQH